MVIGDCSFCEESHVCVCVCGGAGEVQAQMQRKCRQMGSLGCRRRVSQCAGAEAQARWVRWVAFFVNSFVHPSTRQCQGATCHHLRCVWDRRAWEAFSLFLFLSLSLSLSISGLLRVCRTHTCIFVPNMRLEHRVSCACVVGVFVVRFVSHTVSMCHWISRWDFVSCWL